MEISRQKHQLAIFDLDETLIGGDSDYTWGTFLAHKGIVDADWYQDKNKKFYQDYREGNLDINEFLSFVLKPLSEHPKETLIELRSEYMQERVEPLVLPKAEALIQWHREQGHTLLIITATNRFVAEPVAERLGIENLLATEPETKNGQFTGRVKGIPCFQGGKITALNGWLSENDLKSAETWFYSDSHNDIPLLQSVDHPVAVDADEQLSQLADKLGWQRISLR